MFMPQEKKIRRLWLALFALSFPACNHGSVKAWVFGSVVFVAWVLIFGWLRM